MSCHLVWRICCESVVSLGRFALEEVHARGGKHPEDCLASFAGLDTFARGQIWGMRQAGASRDTIADSVRKKDGTRHLLRALDGVLAQKRLNPTRRGDD